MAIRILPPDVVNLIAAGEVVQRPANAVKELLENSLDAGAMSVTVTLESPAGDAWSVVDDGAGISAADLPLAAARHATSKLAAAADFAALRSFGFRGEALAAVSACADLTIVSRPVAARVGHRQAYRDGAPCGGPPQPCARTPGTTVRVERLFYNVPHRRKALASTESYQQVLAALQSYAILVARDGVALVCQRKTRGNLQVDLNTTLAVQHCRGSGAEMAVAITSEQRATATRQVMQQVYGSQIGPHLGEFTSQLVQAAPDGPAETKGDSTEDDTVSYSCHGFVTSPSYIQNTHTTFLLFCNQRLVQCSPLKRAVEAVYAEFTKAKPLVFLSIQVPPDQVDVNVHPTKQQVTLLHLDAITYHLQERLRAYLHSQGQSFARQTVLSQPSALKKRKPEKENQQISNAQTSQDAASRSQSATKPPPSKLIRTSRGTHRGSIEPFVVVNPSQSQVPTPSAESDSQSGSQPEPDSEASAASSAERLRHQPGCPLMASPSDDNRNDMTEPGAFAKVAALCTCRTIESTGQPVAKPPAQVQPPLKKIQPSLCELTSVASLRRKITKRAADPATVARLRSSCLVGVVSHQRCLLQCGADLVLLNYFEGACELFYQLALLRFGEHPVGRCAVPIDVEVVLAQFVELEDRLQQNERFDEDSTDLLQVSENNETVAAQAASFLQEKAAMLREYFSIQLETDKEGRLVLTGLPVLLQGHTPSPHGLALFLLRLATEVNYKQEKPCFRGVCWELGFYYASVAATDDDGWHALVRHCLFPAISGLLTPSKTLQEGFMTTVANLSQLYKVFERC